jgi:hypothetical protein
MPSTSQYSTIPHYHHHHQHHHQRSITISPNKPEPYHISISIYHLSINQSTEHSTHTLSHTYLDLYRQRLRQCTCCLIIVIIITRSAQRYVPEIALSIHTLTQLPFLNTNHARPTRVRRLNNATQRTSSTRACRTNPTNTLSQPPYRVCSMLLSVTRPCEILTHSHIR